MNYYDDYPEEMFEDPELLVELELPSLSEITETCAVPSLFQLYNYIESLLFYCFLFRILSNLAQRIKYFEFLVHIISIVCGNLVLLSIIGTSVFYCIAFIYFTYFIFLILMKWERAKGILGYIMGVFCLTILTSCEVFEWDPAIWRQIRGVQMVATMKIVSLAFDMDAAETRNTSPLPSKDKPITKNKPDALSYLGYMFCPTNCVLGPWTSYTEYMAVARENKLIDTKNIFWTFSNLILTLTFAVASNCFVPALVPPGRSSKWLIAYRDALSFRCSHYFVSFLSQLTMVMGGFADQTESHISSRFFGYQVVRPLSIEFPRSLTEVVTDWNIPIHNWLKQYVFRTVRRKSITFAIFLTYLVSSLLHGMNLQLATVLLSLGLFSLVEHNLRKNIAESLSACVRVYPCKNCNHSLKRYSPVTMITNILFSGFTVVHLAFLGTVFNISTTSGNDDDEFAFSSAWNKWSELNFASYWICFGCLLCDILLRI